MKTLGIVVAFAAICSTTTSVAVERFPIPPPPPPPRRSDPSLASSRSSTTGVNTSANQSRSDLTPPVSIVQSLQGYFVNLERKVDDLLKIEQQLAGFKHIGNIGPRAFPLNTTIITKNRNTMTTTMVPAFEENIKSDLNSAKADIIKLKADVKSLLELDLFAAIDPNSIGDDDDEIPTWDIHWTDEDNNTTVAEKRLVYKDPPPPNYNIKPIPHGHRIGWAKPECVREPWRTCKSLVPVYSFDKECHAVRNHRGRLGWTCYKDE